MLPVVYFFLFTAKKVWSHRQVDLRVFFSPFVRALWRNERANGWVVCVYSMRTHTHFLFIYKIFFAQFALKLDLLSYPHQLFQLLLVWVFFYLFLFLLFFLRSSSNHLTYAPNQIVTHISHHHTILIIQRTETRVPIVDLLSYILHYNISSAIFPLI